MNSNLVALKLHIVRFRAFVKTQKKNIFFFFWGGEVGLGVRVDVNGELKLL